MYGKHIKRWLARFGVYRARRVWLQNETLENVRYWVERGELYDHALRKRYVRDKYNRVTIGEPQPSARAAELSDRGLVGLYGYRDG